MGDQDIIKLQQENAALRQRIAALEAQAETSATSQSKLSAPNLRESERKLRGIIEYSIDGIVLTDEEGRVIEWNEAQSRLTGQPREEMLGQFVWDVMYDVAVPEQQTPRHYEQVKQAFQSFFAGAVDLSTLGRIRNVEIQHRNGERRYVQEVAFAIQTKRGNMLCGISRDVTLQKKTEEALRYRIELEELVSIISTHFINVSSDRFEGEINQTLQLIGQFAGVERVYINLFDAEELIINEVYEWYSPSSQSKAEAFLGMSIAPMEWALVKLRKFDYIYVPNLEELPPEAAFEKGIWQANNLQAVLSLPLVIDNALAGILGFSMEQRRKEWSEEDLNLLGLVAEIFSNVLARRRIEQEKEKHRQALRESEERYRTLFERTLNPILVIDTNGHYITANQAALQFLECSAEELIGRKVDYFLPPDKEKSKIMEVHRPLWEKGGAVETEYYIKGRVKILELTITPAIWQSRPVVFGVGKDITERKQAEKARRQSEARFRTVSDLVSDFAYAAQIRPDGSVLVEWTTMHTEFSGRTFPSITAVYETMIYPEDKPLLVQRIEKLLSGQEDVSEYRMIGFQTGRLYWVRDYSRPIWSESEQRVVRIIGAIQNITERRQAEEALRQSKKQLEETLVELQTTQQQVLEQERLAAVGQLAAGIAHDFNNLLTSIIGFAELAQSDPALPDHLQPDLERIVRQGQRGAHLVRQILDFGRKAIRQPQPLDLIPFIKEAVRFLERTIPEYIHISLEIEATELPVKADPTQLQQMLTNLALNARDAMPNGGWLKVRLSQLDLSPDKRPPSPELSPGQWAICLVSDTGDGISPETLPHIFEPFFTTKRAGQGSGLGLAQVYGIVKQHNGHIEVKSVPGVGTEFTIFLPLQPVAPGPDAGDAIDIQQGRGETILLVEDEPEVLAVTEAILKKLGYQVLSAANGQQALALYQTHAEEIDLALSDMVMPNMDGLTLFQILKEQNPALKMILMSGYPLGEEDEPRFLNRSGIRWLQKPLSLSRVAQVVGQALQESG